LFPRSKSDGLPQLLNGDDGTTAKAGGTTAEAGGATAEADGGRLRR
jgi:hypothetical protein